MYKVKDFIYWALSHIKPYTVPSGANLVRPWNECGAEPWQYLFGSVRVKTSQATIDRYYENHYKSQMTRERYNALTKDWDRNGYATDCEGLLDAWLTYECNDPTDNNANGNYVTWCTDKGKLSEIDRPYVVGEALFMANTAGKMTHIGWVCGFGLDGDPLVVEARGIAYGVVITKLSGRNWTHRGLMTKKFEYEKNEEEKPVIDFNQTKPMPSGETYRAMQQVLDACGFTDYEDKPIEVDGKWGNRSKSAFTKFIAYYAPEPVPVTQEYTVCVRDTEGKELYNWSCNL